ncbi:amino acid ABC transporter substrate-binding protein [Deinococcus psychrotolerans]|uniref:Amino acid ABC transporter substrate-binding protein n=1 Tax=Deinococcus psychrotolerans TaxID=2489213 RepID=A0A3G8YMG7_9DEIO|nr:ABC transporter substrate-binding protein [Deinococcus psychrotolerans]AZI42346.1 amino acid ABC transporter substrate-binding protein [Deinococcus psychrotolerans]
MKRTILALTALTLLASAAQARTWDQIKAAGTIKIATEGAFKPFNYFEGKKLTGFEIDLADAIAKQLGLKVEWITQPFDNLLIGLGQDRYDFVIASHGISPERAKAVDFSDPHYCTGGAIVSKPGGPKSAADLVGKTVVVQVGTTYLDNVKKIKGIKDVKTFQKDTDAQAALMSGRADAWVSDKFLGLDAIKSVPGKLVQGDLLFQEKIAMAVKKGNTSLTKELNASLSKLENNGVYAKLSNQYFGQDIRCK